MVSRIQLKLSTGVDHTVASRDITPRSKGQRIWSQGHVGYTSKSCYN